MKRRILNLWLAAVLALTPALVADSPFDGRWEGAINLPNNGSLEIDIDLASDAVGTLSGDISIPIQSIEDRTLGDFEIDGRSVRFNIPGIPGNPTFDGKLSDDGDTLSGSFYQGGGTLTFSLEQRADPVAAAGAALDGFEALVEKAVKDFNVPGLGLAIVQDGEVILARGFGHRDLERQLPMTENSLFAIGSTTKAMTATVLGMLVDEGHLDWDQPLVRYLPSFRLADPMITARITPRDLVTHRSGLPRHDLLWYNNNDGSRGEMVARLAHLELTADLRERFQYNNLMFMTAGYLAGQLDGGTWEESMRQRLFGPLGMSRSNFSVADSPPDTDHALPYRENEDDELERIPFRRIDLAGPAGSVNSSVLEMAQWLRFNLAKGKMDGQQLIQEATLADIHSPHMATPTPSPESRISQSAYGLGWVIQVYRGHRRILHGGGIDGFSTSVMFFPDDDLGLVAFTNRGSGLGTLVNQHAADRILGLEPVDWLGDALRRASQNEADVEAAESKENTARISDTQPSHPLEAYVGSYAHAGYGEAKVRLDDGVLAFTFNGITTPLEHWHYDVWHGAEGAEDPTFEGTKIQFRADFDGQISELRAPFELTASPIVFTKQPDPKLSDPAHLTRYTGTYQSVSGQRGEIKLNGNQLTVHLPGQPVYTLVPQVSGRFAIEGLQGFSLGFEEDGNGQVSKVVFYQPNGVFESARVEE